MSRYFIFDDGDDGSHGTYDSVGDYDGGIKMERMEMKRAVVGGGDGAEGSSNDDDGVGDSGLVAQDSARLVTVTVVVLLETMVVSMAVTVVVTIMVMLVLVS